MKKHSISPAGIPETDPEWRTWEEAQRAINKHLGEGHEGGRSEYDPSVWMMGKHAPQHEKYNQGVDPADPEGNEAHSEPDERYDGPVMCHDCACYLSNGEGDPDHEEKFERGMQRFGPSNHPVLNCPEDRECHESGRCGICGEDINEYGMYGPEGHRMAILGDSADGGVHRVAGAVSRNSDTIWR